MFNQIGVPMIHAKTFTAFAESQARSANFDSVAEMRQHFSEMQYKSWLDSAIIEYYRYLTERCPNITLAQAHSLFVLARDCEQPVIERRFINQV
jgi:hypothetical protein